MMTTRAQSESMQTARADYLLLTLVVILLSIGLLMIWSISVPLNTNNGEDPFADLIRHTIYVGIGLTGLFIAMRIDYRVWDRLAVLMFVLTIPLLVGLFTQAPVNGARRWYHFLGEGTVQPAELAKFTFIVYIAKWLTSKGDKLQQVTYGLIPFAVLVGIVDGLIVLQPNHSTAILIGLCAVIMFFVAGADVAQFLLLLLAGGVGLIFMAKQFPYLAQRFEIFLQDPLTSVGDATYHIRQTIIFMASGGFFGVGLGLGVGKYNHIPTPQTDSIFALMGEELGLVGTWAVLALFLAMAYRGFRIAARTKDPFGQLLATGITVWLILQALINIGVVTASIPFTGVPLPFISYGGSALITSLGAMGVLLNISRNGAETAEEGNAVFNFGWGNGRARLSRVDSRRRTAEARSRE